MILCWHNWQHVVRVRPPLWDQKAKVSLEKCTKCGRTRAK